MIKFAQHALLAAAVTLTPMAAATQAEARDRYYRHDHHRGGDALALGVIGLATGVIVGSALANPPPQRRVYIDRPASVYDDGDYYVDDYPPPPPPRHTYRPRPVYQQPQPVYQSYGIEPWTGAWYDYCSQRYRSFNPRTGTFVGYDGRTHFCTAG